MFITFEGLDGSGKTTVLNKLIDYLQKNDVNFVSTKEPGSSISKENKKIRAIIVDNQTNITPMTEAILFSADRRLHLEKLILPALKKGKLVICDRYFDSTFAYQGAGRGLGIQKMIELQENITDKTYPDKTFYFDISVEESLKRVDNRGGHNRLDNENKFFFQKVYEGYKEIIKKTPDRFIIIDASQSQKKVYNQVLKEFKKILKI